MPTESGHVPWGSLSVTEQKDDLRTRNADLAERLVDLTGWGHARFQGELNQLAGVARVATATVDQLERRLRYGELAAPTPARLSKHEHGRARTSRTRRPYTDRMPLAMAAS